MVRSVHTYEAVEHGPLDHFPGHGVGAKNARGKDETIGDNGGRVDAGTQDGGVIGPDSDAGGHGGRGEDGRMKVMKRREQNMSSQRT